MNLPVNASQVIEAIQTFNDSDVGQFVEGFVPVVKKIPLDLLLKLADAIAKEVQAKTELAAMQSAVSAADAAADAAEAEALKS